MFERLKKRVVVAATLLLTFCGLQAMTDGSDAYVAQVGETKYTSLQEAIDSASSGDTIKLLRDHTEGVRFPTRGAGKSVTLDLQGYKLTGARTKLGSAYLPMPVVFAVNAQDCELTITDSTDSDTSSLVVPEGGCYFYLTGAASSGTILNIDAGSYENETLVKLDDELIYDIYDDPPTLLYYDLGIVINVFGGRFDSWEFVASDDLLKEGAVTVALEGGTFGEDPSGLLAEDFRADKNSDNKWVVTARDYVAQIEGGKKYETLAEAVAAAASNVTASVTITLLKNCSGDGIQIPANKFAATQALTIDLAGYTYTCNGNPVGSQGTENQAFQLLAGNIITFQNGTLQVAEEAKSQFRFVIQNYANLTLDNVKVDGTNLALPNKTCYALSNNNGNTMLTGDTEIKAPQNGVAFDVYYYGNTSYPTVNVTVDNAKINGKIEVCADKGATAPTEEGAFGLTLTSGTFTGATLVVDPSAAAATVTKGSSATVDPPHGWKWDGNNSLVAYVAMIGNDGYDTYADAITDAGSDLTKIDVMRVYADRLPAGYYFETKNGKENGGIVRAQAKIGETYYKTFAEAVSAVHPGETITVIDFVNTMEPPADWKFATNNGVTTLVRRDYVVGIGDKKYESIAEAVAAAQNNDVIVLLKDVTAKGTDGWLDLTSKGAVKLTFDLNGKTLAALSAVALGDGTDLTICDNTESKNGRLTSTGAYIGTVMFMGDGATLTVAGGTIEAGTNENAIRVYGHDVDNYSAYYSTGNKVVLAGGKLTGSTLGNYAIVNLGNSDSTEFVVTGGSIEVAEGKKNPVVRTTGHIEGEKANSVEVKPGAEIAAGRVLELQSGEGQFTELAISGGTITVSEGLATTGANVAVSGGTFNVEVPEEFCAEGVIPQVNGDNTYSVKSGYYYAQIGNVKYESLQEAFNVGGDVKLIRDCPVSAWVTNGTKTINLDLAGHTISAAQGTFDGDAIIAVNHGGTLTITDSSEGGTIDSGSVLCAIKMTQNGEDLDMTGDATKCATLVVNGGTIQGYQYGISGNGNAGRGNTSVTVKGGTVKATATPNNGTPHVDSIGIYNPQSGSVTIAGGTVEGAMGVYAKSGTISVTGGTINGTATSEQIAEYGAYNNGATCTGAALAIENANGYSGITSVSITDGTFNSANGEAVASYAAAGKTALTRFVTGGTFNKQIDDYLCALGKSSTQGEGENAPWTVGDWDLNIHNLAQLEMFRDMVNGGNTFAGKTVTLVDDIEIPEGHVWNSCIGNVASYPSTTFNGVFDGGSKTIKNLSVVDTTTPNWGTAGLFGSIGYNGKVMHLTLEDVSILSCHNAGAVVGYSSSDGENGNVMAIIDCHVNGGTVTSTPELMSSGKYDNGYKVGGIIGYMNRGIVRDCSVADLTITAYRDVGGIVGCSSGTLTGNTVEGTKIVQCDTNGYKNEVISTFGEIVGRNLGVTATENTDTDVEFDAPVAAIGNTGYRSFADAIAAAAAAEGGVVINVVNYNENRMRVPNDDWKFVTNEETGTTTLVKKVYVCEVEGVKFESIAEAAAVANNKTVKLIANVTESVHLGSEDEDEQPIEANLSVTFDLNGKLWNGNGAYGALSIDGSKIDVVIEDLSEEKSGVIDSGSSAAFGAILIWGNDDTVTLKSGKILYGTSNEVAAIATLWGENEGCKIQIEGGQIVRKENSEPGSGVFYTCNSSESQSNVEISISGGEIDYGNGRGIFQDAVIPANSKIISGGTFAQEVAEELCAEGFIPQTNADNTFGVKSGYYYAQIGDVKYESLQDAINAAKDGETVTLIKAVTDGSGITIDEGKFGTDGLTIDLGGLTYTASKEPAGSNGTKRQLMQILQGNKVTIKNGTLDVAEQQAKPFRMIIQNYSDLTLDDVTLDGTKLSFTEKPRYTLSNNQGTVTIKDTTIKAYSGEFAFDTCQYKNYNIPSVTVTGDSVIEGKVELAGGNFRVDGGDFANATLAIANTGLGDSLVQKATEAAVAPPTGKAWSLPVDGYVTLGDAIAQIGDVAYVSLAEAASVAQNGDTVKLLQDCEGGYTFANSGVTLVLNGNKVYGYLVFPTQNFEIVNPVEDAYVTVVTSVTRSDDIFEMQSNSPTTYLCANGLAVTFDERTDETDGSVASWTSSGKNYTYMLPANAIVAGGAWDSPVTEGTSVTVNGGTIKYGVFGGGVKEGASVAGTVNVVVNNGTFYDGIVGGGINGDVVDGDVNVTVGKADGTSEIIINENVIGGGFNGNVKGNITLTINGGEAGKNVTATFYAGAGVYGDVDGNVNVIINGGEINGMVAGGSMCTGNVTGNTTVTVKGGVVCDVAGGSLGIYEEVGGKVGGDSTVIVNAGATVKETLSGGAYSGEVAGTTSVVVNGGTVGNDTNQSGHTYGIWGGNFQSEEPMGKITVNGGTFKSTVTSENIQATEVSILGGQFANPVDEGFCAKGYIPTEQDPTTGFYGVKEGTYVVRNSTTGKGYETLAQAMTTAAKGDELKLLASIDLKDSLWTPVSFNGTLDGQGHKIDNLRIEGSNDGHHAFINWSDEGCNVKNITFENAYVKGARAAVVMSNVYGATLDNVVVKDSTVVGEQKCGGLIGMTGEGAPLTITNCEVDGLTLKYVERDQEVAQSSAGTSFGGLVGYLHYGVTATITNNKVGDVTFENLMPQSYYETQEPKYCQFLSHPFIGAVIGTQGGSVTLTGNTVDQVVGIPTGPTTTEFMGFYYREGWTSDSVVDITVDGKLMPNRIIAKIGDVDYYSLTEAMAAVKPGETVKLVNNTKLGSGDSLEQTLPQRVYFDASAVENFDLDNLKLPEDCQANEYAIIEVEPNSAIYAVESSYVAQNTTTGDKFQSLADAFDAAEDDEVIKLLKDWSECVEFPGYYGTSKSGKLDLNGYALVGNQFSLWGANVATAAIVIRSSEASFTLIDSTEDQRGSIVSDGYLVLLDTGAWGATLNVEGGSYYTGDATETTGHQLVEISPYYLYGRNADPANKMNPDIKFTLNISGGCFEGAHPVVSSVDIANGSMHVNVTGGDFTGITGTDFVNYNSQYLDVELKGGYYAAKPVDSVVAQHFIADPWETDDWYVRELVDNFLVTKDGAEDKVFEKLADALAAADEDSTIKLLNDAEDLGKVELPAGVTLDGDGKKISGDSSIYINAAGGTVQNVNFVNIHNAAGKLSAIYAVNLSGTASITGCSFTDCDWDAIQMTPVANAVVSIIGNTFADGMEDQIQQQRFVHIQSAKNVDFAANVTDNDMTGDTAQGALEVYYFTDATKITVSGNYISDLADVCILSNAGDNVIEMVYPMRSQTDVDVDDRLLGVATIKTTYTARFYPTLAAAVAAAQAGDTVTVLADCAGDGIQINKSLTIDFNGKTYTCTGNPTGSSQTKNQVFQLLKDNTITFKNGTVNVTNDVDIAKTFRFIIQDYASLTLDGMTLDASNLALTTTDANGTRTDTYALCVNSGTVLVKDSTLTASSATGITGYALDTSYNSSYTRPTVTVDGDTVLNGTVSLSGGNIEFKDAAEDKVNGQLAFTWDWDGEDATVTKAAEVAIENLPENYYWKDGTTLTAAVAKIGTTMFDTLAASVVAADTGAKIEILRAGTYKIPNLPNNVTITGNVENVVFDCAGTGSIATVSNGATFENVTMNFGQSNYHGFQHAGTINMTGCTLNGLFFSYGVMNFTNCTFNQDAEQYHMWCYGTDCTFTNCTFNGKGKFLNIYCESNATVYNITLTGCTFNSTKANKAAVNVKETCGADMLKYNVVINNCSANGEFPAATAFNPSGALYVISPLVQVDDRNTAATESGITVTLDGTVVYPKGRPTASVTAMESLPTVAGTTADSAWTFTDTTSADLVSSYANWTADFVVTFNKPVAAGTLNLIGSYEAWNSGAWVTMPMSRDIAAGEEIRLLAGANENVTFATIANAVKSFNCGVINLSPDNNGTKMTVNLVITDGANTFQVATANTKFDTAFVAKIGNVGYFTLEAAIEAAQSGSDKTITLLDNITEKIELPQGVKVIPGDYTHDNVTAANGYHLFAENGELVVYPVPLAYVEKNDTPANGLDVEYTFSAFANTNATGCEKTDREIFDAIFNGLTWTSGDANAKLVAALADENQETLTDAEKARAEDILANVGLFSNWNADFVVSFDADIERGTIELAGQYTAWNEEWVTLSDFGAEKDKEYHLMEFVPGSGSITYEELLAYVRTFKCGAKNLDPKNAGVKMTVKLILYPADAPENRIEITGDNTFAEYSFGAGCVAKIGTKYYDTLAGAFEAVTTSETITLLRTDSTDVTLPYGVTFDASASGVAYNGTIDKPADNSVIFNNSNVYTVYPYPEVEVTALETLPNVGGRTLETASAFKYVKGGDPFSSWKADFKVSFSEAVPAESLVLAGSYAAYNQGEWVAVPITDAVTAPMWLMTGLNQNITVKEVMAIGTFQCGAYNLQTANNNTKMTVELYLTDPDGSRSIKVAGGEHTFNTPFVADINNVGYFTLAEALTAAQANQTVTLDADADATDLTLKAGVTLDATKATLEGTLSAPENYMLFENDKVYTVAPYPTVDFGDEEKVAVNGRMLDEAKYFSAYKNKTMTEAAKDAIVNGPFANWIADFEVSADSTIDAGTMTLAGKYGEYSWQSFGGLPAITSTPLPLMGTTDKSVTYADLATAVQTFYCGLCNLSPANNGKKVTVALRLTDPNDSARTIVLKSFDYPISTTFAAEIGSTGYLTIEDAVAAAKDVDTIKLLNDVELADNLATGDKELTLDLNGKTATIPTDMTLTTGANFTVVDNTTASTMGGVVIDGTVAVTGGTLDISTLGYGTSGLVAGKSGSLTISEDATAKMPSLWNGQTANQLQGYNSNFFVDTENGAKVTTDKTYTWDGEFWKVDGEVARVYDGETFKESYDTIAEAVAAATAGQTVKVVAKANIATMVTVDKSITIELNGKTLSGADDSDTQKLFEVVNDATLTVDGSVDGSTVNGRFNVGRTKDNNGNLVLNGGTYEVGEGETVVHVNGDCTDSDVTITGATVTSETDNGVQFNGAGTFKIEDSTVSGATAIYMKAGELLVTNSTVTATATTYTEPSVYHNGSNATGDAIVLDSADGYNGDIKLAIGGDSTVTSTSGSAIRECITDRAASDTQMIAISGGKFGSASGTEVIKVSEGFKPEDNASISGGYFSAELSNDYCADGVSFFDSGDSDYPYVASMDVFTFNVELDETTTVSIPRGWIKENVNVADVSNDSAVKAALAGTQDNGQQVWVNYVMGLDPTKDLNATFVRDSASTETKPTIGMKFLGQGPLPQGTGVTVTYTLRKKKVGDTDFVETTIVSTTGVLTFDMPNDTTSEVDTWLYQIKVEMKKDQAANK